MACSAPVHDDLEAELLITYARLHRHNTPQRRSQAEPPLPWHEEASAALKALRAAITAEEQHDAEAAGWALLDPGDPPRLVGPCRCGALIWTHRSDAGAQVECDRCGRTHDVDAVRRTLLRACEGALVDYATASRALLVLLGKEQATSTLRTWVQRGELAVQAWQGLSSRPLLRLGDVIDHATRPR